MGYIMVGAIGGVYSTVWLWRSGYPMIGEATASFIGCLVAAVAVWVWLNHFLRVRLYLPPIRVLFLLGTIVIGGMTALGLRDLPGWDSPGHVIWIGVMLWIYLVIALGFYNHWRFKRTTTTPQPTNGQAAQEP